jgi:hypothetical protein
MPPKKPKGFTSRKKKKTNDLRTKEVSDLMMQMSRTRVNLQFIMHYL